MKKAAFLLAIALFAAWSAPAATVAVTVNDARGAPLADAVAWAVPRAPLPGRARPTAAVEQLDKVFVPLVTAVQVGTLVQFPNRDEIRHHVYSFSPAKVFELKLYAGTPVAPVLFDKPGDVVLGCNIHDHMIAYIYVVDSPFFGKAAANGQVRLDGMPAGEYDVHVWHYAQTARADAQPLRLRAGEAGTARFAVAVKPLPPRHPPR